MGAFGNGIAFGLVLMLAMGPVFFAIVQTSLQRGFKSAVIFAAGVMLSDVFYVILASFGLAQLVDSDSFKFIVAVAGGAILISFGLINILRKTKDQSEIDKSYTDLEWKGNVIKYLAKGWAINFLNPSVLIYWVGVVSMANVEYKIHSFEQNLFFLGIIFTVFTSDILKAYAANRLRRVVTPKFIHNANVIIGVLLVMFGAYLFWSAFQPESIL